MLLFMDDRRQNMFLQMSCGRRKCLELTKLCHILYNYSISPITSLN